MTREKIELGKMLFFDPRLSVSHLISCNTCHNLAMGGDANLAKAIAAFEATLITPGSRFEQFLEGNVAALTANEREAGAEAVHGQKLRRLSPGGQSWGAEYYPFSVVEKPGANVLPAKDRGRFEVWKTADADYVFRAGPLRNIELTAPYFHSGKVWDLKQAVAIMAPSQLGAKLSDKEVDAITALLKALTGEPPRVELPILLVSSDKTPLPR